MLIYKLKPIQNYENYNNYKNIKYFMFKHNDDIYLTIGYDVYEVINITKQTFYYFKLHFKYENLISFYTNNRLIILNDKDSKMIYDVDNFAEPINFINKVNQSMYNFEDLCMSDKENNEISNETSHKISNGISNEILKLLTLPKEFNNKYEKVLKASENLCVLFNFQEHKIFDFETFKFKQIYKHDNSLESSNYYYIDDNHYLYNTKLYIIFKKNNIYDYNNNEKIILKSSKSDKSWNISKDLLIKRCGLFKNINNDSNEFISEHFENMDLYLEYIKNDYIKTKYDYVNISNYLICLNSIRLFDLCLYLQDSDIDNIAYYLVSNYNKKYIYECLSRLKDFTKQKNILIDNYLRKIKFYEYNKFINKCDNDLLLYFISYNSRFYNEYTKII